MLIWSSHSSSPQSLMVLFCYGLCINILARFLRPSFISSILFSYPSPLFILTKRLLPVFCSPKPPYVGLLLTFSYTVVSPPLLFVFPNPPIEVVTLLCCLSITLGSHWHFPLSHPSSPHSIYNLLSWVSTSLWFYLLIISWISLFLYICC